MYILELKDDSPPCSAHTAVLLCYQVMRLSRWNYDNCMRLFQATSTELGEEE